MIPFLPVDVLVYFDPHIVSGIQALEATKAIFVRFEDDEMVSRPVSAELIVSVRGLAMEVEDVDQVALFVDNELLFFVSHSNKLVLGDH